MLQWGHKISDVELNNLMSIADVDGDGLIDYNEFVAATMHMSQLEKVGHVIDVMRTWTLQNGRQLGSVEGANGFKVGSQAS